MYLSLFYFTQKTTFAGTKIIQWTVLFEQFNILACLYLIAARYDLTAIYSAAEPLIDLIY